MHEGVQQRIRMQTVQKTITQYDVRSLAKRPNQDEMEENMAVAPTSGTQIDTTAELASIKTLLQGIALDMSGLKSGMDSVQNAVETLGA